jgi:hypothetical protein
VKGEEGVHGFAFKFLIELSAFLFLSIWDEGGDVR